MQHNGGNQRDNRRPSFGRPPQKGGFPARRPNPKQGFPERKPVSRDNPRRVALDTLDQVFSDDAYASLALDERLRATDLTQVDKRLCTSIVYKTLENAIRIDYMLAPYVKDADALEKRVRSILRMSVCQIMFHDRIPENAVVDEAVKLTRAIGMEPMCPLVNAVLRNFLRGRESIVYPKPAEGARYLSVMYSVPQWLAERLMAAYGDKQALAICAYRNDAHAITIRPNLALTDDAGLEKLLAKKVWQTEKGRVPHAYRVMQASGIARDSDYGAGLFSIQGEGSMLAAQAMDVKPGMQVLDCCAAPGGKTAYLAETMQGTGRVHAWDIHPHRVELVRATMRRLRLDNVRPAVRDASIPKQDAEGTMDAVLLDAPCSGLGVMDDKPDVKYRHSPETVKALCDTQKTLLDVCCRYVKPGGTFLYSTCSILPEENTEQIKAFLAAHPEFAIIPLPDSAPEAVKAQYGELGVQLLPHRDGIEGFYIARMRRRKGN